MSILSDIISGRVIKGAMLILAALLSVLWSCSTVEIDDGRKYPHPNDSDAEVFFEIKLPQSQAPTTYAISREKEDTVKSIEILLFKIEGANKTYTGKPYYCDVIDTETGVNSAKKRFTVALPKGGPYDIVILANSRDIVKNSLVTVVPTVTEKADVLKLLTLERNDKWISDVNALGFAPFPMWGELLNKTITENLKFDATLMRMIAKIDVALTTQQAIDNFKLEEIYLVNPNTKGHLVPAEANFSGGVPTAPTLVDGSTISNTPLHYTSAEASIVDKEFKGVIYAFEATKAVGHNLAVATCLVLKGTYTSDGQPYFYRIDFGSRDMATGTLKYLDILRNMKYSVNISRVSGPGYASLSEATTSPSSNINADIVIWNHTELPIVVSDNQNTLGFSRDEIVVGYKESHDDQIKVRTDYEFGGWKLDKIVDALNQPISWINLSTISGVANVTASLQFDFLENQDLTPRVCYLYFSAGNLTHIVKVTQLAAMRMRSIVWDDYTGVNFPTITVVDDEGGVQTSVVSDSGLLLNGVGGAPRSLIIDGVLTKVTVTYKNYVLDVPASKFSFSESTITITDRTLIGEAIHLDKIRENLTDSYIQVDDVSLLGYTNTNGDTDNWVPIGASSDAFSGSYDGGSGNSGKGFTISNLKIDRDITYVGLFGYTTATSTLNKVHIAAGSSIKGQQFVGSICGYTLGKISNCSNSASVLGTNSTGGICGYSLGSITNSSNEAPVTSTGSNVGGIVGQGATITNCHNLANGTIEGVNNIGGITGENGGAGKINRCSNVGAVTARNNTAGGIVGYAAGTSISSCFNKGTIKALSSYAGGICGVIGVGTPEVFACYNTGGVTADISNAAAIGVLETGTITNCYFGGSSPTTGEGTQFSDTAWPNQPPAMTGWETTIWDIGSWNGGVNPIYPTLKP